MPYEDRKPMVDKGSETWFRQLSHQERTDIYLDFKLIKDYLDYAAKLLGCDWRNVPTKIAELQCQVEENKELIEKLKEKLIERVLTN